MGMIGSVVRVTDDELVNFLSNSDAFESKVFSDDSYDSEWFLDVDKSWDGINYILTGNSIMGDESIPNKLGRAFFTHQILDEEQDLGYGPAQYLKPDQVKETHIELEKITNEILNYKIKGSEMVKLGVYPGVWEEKESYEYLTQNFKGFKEFYKKAAENNEAIITYLS